MNSNYYWEPKKSHLILKWNYPCLTISFIGFHWYSRWNYGEFHLILGFLSSQKATNKLFWRRLYDVTLPKHGGQFTTEVIASVRWSEKQHGISETISGSGAISRLFFTKLLILAMLASVRWIETEPESTCWCSRSPDVILPSSVTRGGHWTLEDIWHWYQVLVTTIGHLVTTSWHM